MSKIAAISGFVGKANKAAKFIKVCVRAIEFFKDELDKEFPDLTNQPLKPVENGSNVSE